MKKVWFSLSSQANRMVNSGAHLIDGLEGSFMYEIMQGAFNPMQVHPHDAGYEARGNMLFRGTNYPTPMQMMTDGGVYPRKRDASEEEMGMSNVDHVQGTIVHASGNSKVSQQFAGGSGFVIAFKNTTGVNVAMLTLSGHGTVNSAGDTHDYGHREHETFVQGVPLSHVEFVRPTGRLIGLSNIVIWNTAYDPSNNWFHIDHASFNSAEYEKGNVIARKQGFIDDNMKLIPAAWAKTIYQAICTEFPGMSANTNLERALCLRVIPASIDNVTVAAKWLIKEVVTEFVAYAGKVADTHEEAVTSKLITARLAKEMHAQKSLDWKRAPANKNGNYAGRFMNNALNDSVMLADARNELVSIHPFRD